MIPRLLSAFGLTYLLLLSGLAPISAHRKNVINFEIEEYIDELFV